MIAVDVEQQLGRFRLSVAFRAEAPIVGLFGRSGAGKTAVVNAIAGITMPQRGSIVIDGRLLFDSARGIHLPPEQRRVGYVFQDALLFPHLDVKANLLYGKRLRPSAEHFIDQDKVIELLGLGALLARKPIALSGGEKQRVAIGRALLAQPRIMLFDEPLASLDAARKSEILAYIERLRDELHIPMVYVSHSAAEIARLADTVVLLSEGRCVASGDARQVLREAELESTDDLDEIGSVIETSVARHDPGEQLTTLAFDGGELIVPMLDEAPGERIRAQIQARDVSIALGRLSGISILNILPGRVTAFRSEGASSVYVELAIGGAALTARITRRSMRELDLRVGQEVYALVKAVSFNRRRLGYAS
jgi:molybdate transport system ATP-binding protein